MSRVRGFSAAKNIEPIFVLLSQQRRQWLPLGSIGSGGDVPAPWVVGWCYNQPCCVLVASRPWDGRGAASHLQQRRSSRFSYRIIRVFVARPSKVAQMKAARCCYMWVLERSESDEKWNYAVRKTRREPRYRIQYDSAENSGSSLPPASDFGLGGGSRQTQSPCGSLDSPALVSADIWLRRSCDSMDGTSIGPCGPLRARMKSAMSGPFKTGSGKIDF